MKHLQSKYLAVAFLLALTTACQRTEPIVPFTSASAESGSHSELSSISSPSSPSGESPEPPLAETPPLAQAGLSQEPTPASLAPEIKIPEKDNYGGFLDDPTAPYMEITFDDMAYPDSIDMKALRDGKLYFSYRNDPPGDTGKERFQKNLHQDFSYGFYDLVSQTVSYLSGGTFLNADNQIICTSGESLLMPNGILYQQGVSSQDGCITYTTDFSGNGETKVLAKQEGNYVTPIAHLRAIDSQRFIMNFRDFGNTYDGLYLYDLSQNSIQLILERENHYKDNVQESNCAFDVWGENIWCYYSGNGKDSRHYLRRYNLNGDLQEEFSIPETVSNYKTRLGNDYIPAMMFCLSENTFFAPYMGNNMGFLLKIENGTVVTKPVPEREQLRYMIPNTVGKAAFVYFIDRDNCSLIQLNTNTLEFRSLKLNVIDPEHLSFLQVISDEQGNVVVQDLVTYIDSPTEEHSVHYYYIPCDTVSKYSAATN